MELMVQLLQSAVAAVAVAMMWQCQRLDATRCSSVTDAQQLHGADDASLSARPSPMLATAGADALQSLQSVAVAPMVMDASD